MGRTVKLAVCTLNQWAMDFQGNYTRIIESISQAKAAGARYRLGPELEVCGYGCADHFLESDTFLHSWEVLAEIIQHPDSQDILLDVGMPVMHKDVGYNCRVFILNKKILLIRPKISLCDMGNYREPRYFTGWTARRKVEEHYLPRIIQIISDQKMCMFGDAVIATLDTCLGSEICEELWAADSHHVELGLDGIEIFSNGSGSHFELRKGNIRHDLIKSATMKSGGIYVFSNLVGCDGERVYYDGQSCICVNGQMIAYQDQFTLKEVSTITANVDLESVRSYRNYSKARCLQATNTPAFHRVSVDFSLSSNEPFVLSTYLEMILPNEDPTLLSNIWKLYNPQEEISHGPALWMWDYLRRSGMSGFLLPLSGGIDSTATACIAYLMCIHVFDSLDEPSVLADLRRIVNKGSDYMPRSAQEICNEILVTVYMASDNSSEHTKRLAKTVSQQINSYHYELKIDLITSALMAVFKTVTGLVPRFKAHGGSPRENLALQNVQARVRMVLAYLFAQLSFWSRDKQGGCLVLGSANVDESLRGYMTKYDCSSADINPIGGISKSDLRSFIKHCKIKYNIPILAEILESPPTAELEPLADGKIAQTDEDDMGMTYDELSVFGKLRKNMWCGPYSMYTKLVELWSKHLTPLQIASKVQHFFRSYSINRHKVTTLTPSFHAVNYSPDDNRFDLRPFLYNSRWTWQFNKINKLAERLEDEFKEVKMESDVD